jgi:hypothetical protein
MSKWGQQSRRVTGEHRRGPWSIETENHHRVLWHVRVASLTVGDAWRTTTESREFYRFEAARLRRHANMKSRNVRTALGAAGVEHRAAQTRRARQAAREERWCSPRDETSTRPCFNAPNNPTEVYRTWNAHDTVEGRRQAGSGTRVICMSCSFRQAPTRVEGCVVSSLSGTWNGGVAMDLCCLSPRLRSAMQALPDLWFSMRASAPATRSSRIPPMNVGLIRTFVIDGRVPGEILSFGQHGCNQVI